MDFKPFLAMDKEPMLATDPPVSEKQRRAMWAAAKGHSTIGIPRKVGKEFVGADATAGHAAGILFVAPDGDCLMLHRAKDEQNYAGHWALPGGKAEHNESPEAAAIREAEEEIGYRGTGTLKVLDQRIIPNAMGFHTFVQLVEDKFVPKLNSEHSGYSWAPLGQLPSPIHPGVEATLRERLLPEGSEDMSSEDWNGFTQGFLKWIAEERQEEAHRAQDHLALDAATVRSITPDGRMNVEVSNISKANICPYFGREIPDGIEKLGLDPNRKYKMLRHPEELKKAAATFNNLPLLSQHVALNTLDAHKHLVIGSTGTDASYETPYLKNSLVVWTAEAIKTIESEEAKELSSAYRYQADMTPGVYNDEAYDGVMRNIIGNHVALVTRGRAGPDVVVGDNAIPTLKELLPMSKATLLSRKAAVTKGALMIHLRPRLAMDAQIDLNAILADVTQGNFKEKKADIVKSVQEAVKGKLAQDANVTDVAELLDALEACEEMEGVDSKKARDEFPDKKKDDDDDDKKEKAKDKKAKDEKDDDMKDDDKDKKKAADKKAEDKKAMDEAIAATINPAVESAVAAERKNQQAIREAFNVVEPYVGKIAMDAATAEDVYRGALKALNVNVDGVHSSALRKILELQPKPGSKTPSVKVAMDSASQADYAKRFPHAAAVRTV